MCSSRKNPYPSHGRSSEIPRERGVLKVKILEAKYEAKLEFPGGMGGAKQKTFRGGSMDIFGNCTIVGRPAPFATSYMVHRKDKRTNNRTMLSTLKNNAAAGYQGPVKIKLLKGSGLL